MRGSVTKKGNAWYIVIERERDASSRRRQRWISGSTRAPWMPSGPRRPWRRKDEAEAALPFILTALQRSPLIDPSKATVAEYLTGWLKKTEYRTTTMALYRTQVRAYIIPRIGHLRLQEVKARHLTEFYRELRDVGGRRGQPLGKKSIQNVHSLLRAAFQDAVRDEVLLQNPAVNARLPRFDLGVEDAPTHSRAHTPKEIDGFLTAAETHRLFAMWVLGLTVGLRRGETLALRWADFDPDTRTLYVRRSLVIGESEPEFAPTKTPASNREIDLPDGLVTVLMAHKTRQAVERLAAGSAWSDHDLIFCNEDGSRLHPRRALEITKQVFREAGLEGHIRALRHFFGTQGERLRLDPKVLSTVLGHTSANTLLKHYQRPDAEMKRDAIEQVFSSSFGSAR